ncbi:sperm-associated microtubule inner protein 4 [Pogona vitticeps]
MEVHPGMSFYNNVHDGTALITKTLESTHDLTPLHIPPGPPISPERYEELREHFQLCKPVLKAGQESGGREPMLPESHRNYEPPYRFHHKHHYYGNTQDAPLRLPGMSENTDRDMNYAKYKSPGTLLVEGRYRPFHPYVHCNTDIRGSSPKNEAAGEPFDINRQTRGWPGEHGAFHVSQFAEGNDWAYNPEVPVAWAPKSTLKPPELDISSRAANMLENVKQALWLSTYKRDFSGRGPLNPLLLDDYDAKLIGRVTGELGKYVELRESFPSGTSQVRPLEGRIARALQGRQRPILDPQQQDSPGVHRPPLHSYREHLVVLKDSEGAKNCGKTSLSSFQHDPNASGLWRRNMYFLPNHIKLHIDYPKESTEDKKLPCNRFQKITDTWKTENLYQRQLAIPPEPEPTVKPADPIYYEDLEPSRLNRYIVWHHPVSLSKPGPPDLCFEKPAEIPDPSLTSHPKAISTLPSFPKWIPNCGVAHPQTKLLDIQDSFSKSDAIKRLNDLRRGGLRDLRDHDREGKRHTFQGTHAHFLH